MVAKRLKDLYSRALSKNIVDRLTKPRNLPKGRRKTPRKKPKALEHLDYLSLLGRTKNKKKRNLLLNYGNADQMRAVSECAHNLLQGNVPMKSPEVKKMKRFKTSLRGLANPRMSVDKKKRLLSQQGGGFLGSLIPLAVTALSSLFGNLGKQQ